MLRKAGMTFAGLLTLVIALGAGATDDKKPLPIKQVMKTVCSKQGLCVKCAAAGKSKKWDDAQMYGKQLVECAESLPKDTPKKGKAESWEKLSSKFVDQSKAIAAAADDKDAKALNKAVGAFKMSCGACHKAHKGK